MADNFPGFSEEQLLSIFNSRSTVKDPKLRLKKPESDLQRVLRRLKDAELSRLVVQHLIREVRKAQNPRRPEAAVQIHWIVGPQRNSCLVELAAELGARTYFRSVSKKWDNLHILPGEKVLQASAISVSHDCLRLVRNRIRQCNDTGVRPDQFVPAVISLISPKSVIEFEGGQVISLNDANPKEWRNNKCYACGGCRQGRFVRRKR